MNAYAAHWQRLFHSSSRSQHLVLHREPRPRAADRAVRRQPAPIDRRAADRHSGGDWFCTGDMGYLADGQLYVTGRKKDLIIVGGKNIYPQDLEALASSVPGIYPGRAAAFGLQNQRLGTEEVVMVCELAGAADAAAVQQIERELRRRVVQELDVTLADVRLVERRWLLKTSSGKVARSANREKYLNVFCDDIGAIQ